MGGYYRICKYVLGHALRVEAGGQTVEKVEQLLNNADWRAHCEDWDAKQKRERRRWQHVQRRYKDAAKR